MTTQTTTRVPPAVTVIVAVLTLAAAILVIMNLIRLIFGGGGGAAAAWVIGMFAASLVGVVLLGLLRAYEPRRLTIEQSGMTLEDRRGARVFSWSEVSGVAVLQGGAMSGRSLVIEGPTSVAAARRSRRLSGVTRKTSGVLPLATVIPLRNLDAGEQMIVDAIRRFSGGRFPDPERHLLRQRRRR